MIRPPVLGRRSMRGTQPLRLGLFGPNCSSGRYITLAPERWSASWDDNLRMARLADEAGLDFLLPIGRWKGYGGDSDYAGTSYETITWATGLLAATRRITCFGTVHVPLFHPLIAAKQMVTADHVGEGRFGLNIVCGWNEGEFAMFGLAQQDHSGRYRQGQEWIDVVTRAWSEDDFDFHGEYYDLRGVREKPKPYGGTRPLILNAGRSDEGHAFALRNSDALFTQPGNAGFDAAGLAAASALVARAKDEARTIGREIDVYTVGYVCCRPTAAEAEEYLRYIIEQNADWKAVDNIMAMRGVGADLSPGELQRARLRYASNSGGFSLTGSADDVARGLTLIAEMGYAGIALTLVNYADDLPFFASEVLPRLVRNGVRHAG
jgi:alkanesulfonate monooxygenase SsuD/methylene tetrahydromethanopterin reductase-like flavin-dependent oxidoreductase (luciferase family)